MPKRRKKEAGTPWRPRNPNNQTILRSLSNNPAEHVAAKWIAVFRRSHFQGQHSYAPNSALSYTWQKLTVFCPLFPSGFQN